MDNNDVLVGRVLTRRDAVRLLVASGTALVAGCGKPSDAPPNSNAATSGGASATAEGEVATLPACVVQPELTVGPYFIDNQLDRSDIRADPTTGAIRPGAPLALTFTVSELGGSSCKPIDGAMVDVWQCDAAGEYSGVNDGQAGFDTRGQKFLRGYQVTDKNGVARFTTIYPGWYRGRTVHIHFHGSSTSTSGTGRKSPRYSRTRPKMRNAMANQKAA